MALRSRLTIMKNFATGVFEYHRPYITAANYQKSIDLPKVLSALCNGIHQSVQRIRSSASSRSKGNNSVAEFISMNTTFKKEFRSLSLSDAGKLSHHTGLFSGILNSHFANLSQRITALTVLRNFNTLVLTQSKVVTQQTATSETSVKCCRIRMKHSLPKVPPTRMMSVYDIERTITDEEAAKEFVYALKTSERKYLYEELARFHGDTSVLNNMATEQQPTRQQLKQVTLHQMFPFIGFGFLDNFLMIVANIPEQGKRAEKSATKLLGILFSEKGFDLNEAFKGEYIDLMLGASLGISTMAAAALGNWFSDVCGLGSAHYVENFVSRFGIRHPHLSPAQVDMKSTKWASNFGKVIGVTIGCLLGMCPLLFFRDDKKKKEEAEKDKQE